MNRNRVRQIGGEDAEVTPLTVSIGTLDGISVPVIKRNTPIPVSKARIFTTRFDNQTSAHIHVLQGERVMAANNKTLALFILSGIPAAACGVPQIEITFDVDANGILSIAAKEKRTGKKLEISTVMSSGGLSRDKIEVMKKDAELHAEEDDEKRESLLHGIFKL